MCVEGGRVTITNMNTTPIKLEAVVVMDTLQEWMHQIFMKASRTICKENTSMPINCNHNEFYDSLSSTIILTSMKNSAGKLWFEKMS